MFSTALDKRRFPEHQCSINQMVTLRGSTDKETKTQLSMVLRGRSSPAGRLPRVRMENCASRLFLLPSILFQGYGITANKDVNLNNLFPPVLICQQNFRLHMLLLRPNSSKEVPDGGGNSSMLATPL